MVATQNQGKQQELRSLLSLSGVELVFPNELPSVANLDVVEDGSTFAENAELKARAFAQASKLLSVAEDTGLQVRALGNKPGVASKRWHLGSDLDRNQALLEQLNDKTDRFAEFVTVACLFDPVTKSPEYFVGKMTGSISSTIAVGTGFGYDPIFIPTGETKTLAELGMAVKNAISHRAHAFKKVRSYLEKAL
ncbi:MAG: RdgB/HAM1 family non-canonical purine NTP pyrophosphatase [bacterium]|nr:RdgB/HAM1 family non-canonical purine NTP pyrophosphatase [bacterium]